MLARQRVYAWAAANGHRILRCEYRWLARGPFSWFTSYAQAVYAVVLETPDGAQRACWVRVGDFFIGMLSSQIQVLWQTDP
jgi:hypothetical protein